MNKSNDDAEPHGSPAPAGIIMLVFASAALIGTIVLVLIFGG